jgi:hypothetical protein
MPRHIFIVARASSDLHEYLTRQFEDESNVEVILDRRYQERRRIRDHEGPERRRYDRRTHQAVDDELQDRSHAIVTIPDP